MTLGLIALVLYIVHRFLRPYLPFIAIVVVLFYAANGHLPWTPKQQKKAWNKAVSIFKEK